jgi:uncharacterized protein (TIGR03083 family)
VTIDFVAEIRRESDRFYRLAADADPETRVLSCPEWDVADLVWHLGEVHWFWRTVVETQASDPEAVEAAKPDRPAAYPDVIAFGRAQAEGLLAALSTTADDVPVWTWALDDADHSVGFIRRHQVQEVAVHRFDLELAALGAGSPIDPQSAADSIDEALHIVLPWTVDADKPLSGSVHIHCTDVPGEWYVEPAGDVERVHRKGDVALRGGASELLLVMYKRLTSDTLDIVGDGAVAQDFLARLDGS